MCDMCANTAIESKKDVTGRIHRACTGHRKYLAGWVQDANAEYHSENAAAAKYEEMAYGGRD